jgi:hypothetical protein
VCPEGLAELGPADVDLTLGGLNADLPMPTTDCLTESEGGSMCASLSAIVEGSPREIRCVSPAGQATTGTSFQCSAGNGESITLDTLGFGGVPVPGTFSFTHTSDARGPLILELEAGTWSSGSDNFVEARVAGWTSKWVSSNYCRTSAWGAVAATWSSTGGGELRVRGTFHSRSY